MMPKRVLSVTGPKAAFVAAFGYVVLHLVTLDRSPTPYFDDTFFASVTDALRSTGELRLEISPLYFGKPVYIYGPLYFAAAAGVLEVLGFGSFQFRLIALSFGLGIIWLLYKLLRVGGASHGMGLVICALLAIDPTFYKSLHSGRMDSMALFLLLLSLYLVLLPEPGRSISRVTRIVLSGIAAAGALLTTPRPGYLLALIGVIMLARSRTIPGAHPVRDLLMWSLPIVVLWGGWLFYAFGTIPNMVDYYGSVPGTYLGGFTVRLAHLPMLVSLLILSLALALRTKSISWIRNEIVFFAVCGVMLFYVVVHDPSVLYAFFMVPLACLGIGLISERLFAYHVKRLPFTIIALLICASTVALLARNALVAAQWHARSPDRAREFLARHVPPGAKVVGDEKYYFAARSLGAEFQYGSRGGSLEERVAYHNSVFPADFLITDLSEESTLVQSYKRGLSLEKVDSLSTLEGGAFSRWLSSVASIVGFIPDAGYSGTLWARAGVESATSVTKGRPEVYQPLTHAGGSLGDGKGKLGSRVRSSHQ